MKKYFLCFVFLLTAGFIFTSCGNQESEETYSVTVKKCTGGRVTASPSSSVNAGQRVTLKVVPDDGYEEGSVTVKSGQFKSVDYDGDTATFIMPSEDVTVSALFNKVYVWDTYTVTLEQCEKGVISADKSEGVDCSQYVTVTFTPDEGCVTDTKTICVKNEDGNEVSVTVIEKSADTFKFKMPKHNIRVCAGFKVDDSWSYPVPVSAGRREINGKFYDLVYFGVYPQTVAPQDLDESAFDDRRKVVMGGLTYCYNTQDKSYYCHVLEDTYGDYNSYSDGSAAHISSDNSYRWFKVEPVKWRVLKTYNDGTALLLSEKILNASCYYDYPRYGADENSYYNRSIDDVTVKPNNYAASAIRAYLNGLSYKTNSGSYYATTLKTNTTYEGNGFIREAFTDKASALLQDYEIESGINDKVFLLSKDELSTEEYGFSSDSDRRMTNTDYALTNYLNTCDTYITRTIYDNYYKVNRVHTNGAFDWYYIYPESGIVPACLVKMGN